MTTEKQCKDCANDVMLGYVKKLPKRQANDPGPRCRTHHRVALRARKAAAHEKRVTSTYELKEGEYAQLYSFQRGLCALCRRATGASRRLSVDHNHATGEVRGLLCRPCNTLLGFARDRLDFFRRCISYLTLSPCAAMRQGWTEWYEDE